MIIILLKAKIWYDTFYRNLKTATSNLMKQTKRVAYKHRVLVSSINNHMDINSVPMYVNDEDHSGPYDPRGCYLIVETGTRADTLEARW